MQMLHEPVQVIGMNAEQGRGGAEIALGLFERALDDGAFRRWMASRRRPGRCCPEGSSAPGKGRIVSGRSPARMRSLAPKTTECSMAFSSSRTFPGHA